MGGYFSKHLKEHTVFLLSHTLYGPAHRYTCILLHVCICVFISHSGFGSGASLNGHVVVGQLS